MITHIVLFTPKHDLTESERRSFATSVIEALRTIPSVRRFTLGKRVAVDPGYERSFGGMTYERSAVVEFAGPEELIAYLNHSLHHRLGELFWKYCADTVVVETETPPEDFDQALEFLASDQ